LILNRTVERALGLAKEMEMALGLSPGTIMAGPLNGEGVSKAEQFIPDLVVQTTSCGMHPREDEDPFPNLSFRGREVVYDLVYTPKETRFLKRAKATGCSVIYGDAMLIHQAFRQFLLFTGQEYPPQLIEGM
jgi:3-dehydroquinate dehydratase/shikimate dehydrogenase